MLKEKTIESFGVVIRRSPFEEVARLIEDNLQSVKVPVGEVNVNLEDMDNSDPDVDFWQSLIEELAVNPSVLDLAKRTMALLGEDEIRRMGVYVASPADNENRTGSTAIERIYEWRLQELFLERLAQG